MLLRDSKVVDLKATTCIIFSLPLLIFIRPRLRSRESEMVGREIPKSIGVAAAAAVSPFPWEAIQEINERSLELLVQIARSDANSVMLRSTIRELLRQTSPEARKSAATHAYLLIDLKFRNLTWWEAVRRSPQKQFEGQAGRNTLPKRSAVSLARALLMASREAIRSDIEIARLVLGIDPQVAELLSGVQIADIDRIAEHQFRHVEPRWLDHPAVWPELLLSVPNPQSIKSPSNAHCFQLLIGDLLLSTKAVGESSRPSP